MSSLAVARGNSTPVSNEFRHENRPLSRFADTIKGIFWSCFWKITTSRFALFLLRFKVLKSETWLEKASCARANAIFWKAVNNVPAYKEHVANSGPFPRTFNDIPVTDKLSYIKPHADAHTLHRTMWNGKLPYNGQCDTSTGTTGKPTMWVRGTEEREMVKTLIHFATRVVVGNQPLFFINAFALGPWATGMTTSNALFDRAVTFSTGPDIEKIFDVLSSFPPEQHPDRRYAIAGYPPFMKDLCEEARRRNFDLNKYNITAVVGGEAIADGIRSTVLGHDAEGVKKEQGFSQVLSSYGASDLDINIGYESGFELDLRNAAKKHVAFKEELFGKGEPLPSIFHYDPLNYYIETNAESELIFTCLRDDRVSPRIRYNLHDRGKIMRVQEVMKIAKSHGIELPEPRTNLPLVFVWGRDDTVNYRGAKVPIQHLQEAVLQVLGPHVVQNMAFKVIESLAGPKVSIMLELCKDATIIQPTQTAKLIEKLKKINQDFAFQVNHANSSDLPAVEVFQHGKSPMSNQDPHRKRQYIYKVA